MADTNAKATSDAAQADSGAGAHTSGTHTDAYEGSIKQASDINAEEVASILQNLIAANAKRTYDLAQSTDLSAQVGDSTHRTTTNNLAEQALQNAIETANMVSKQAVRHSDIAIDRQWNVDEVSTLTAKSGVEADAIMSVLVEALAARLSDVE